MAVARLVMSVALALCLGASGDAVLASGNPIRKVVTLMQNMQKEIEGEGAKEQELYDKFMCYCQTNDGSLEKQAADGKARIEELEAKIKQETAEKSQLAQDVIQHTQDVQAAETDLGKATALREREAREYAAVKADSDTNIKATKGAIPDLERGMGSASFMQTTDGDRLRRIAETFQFADDYDRKNVLAFLEQGGDFVPQSGQIVGILKNMLDTMESSLKQATSDEDVAIAGFADLKQAKTDEIQAGKGAITTKNTRSGSLSLSTVQADSDLEDTTTEVADVEKLLATLKAQCGTKEKEWAKRTALRNQEIEAISEAISMLNDDDALDIFKKALPSALLQSRMVGFIQRSASNTEATALRKVQAMIASLAGGSHQSKMLRVMFLNLSSKLSSQLRLFAKGKARDFGDVIGMVDNMVTLEGKEQQSDNAEKPWCNGEFDKKDREDKSEKTEIGKLESEIDEENDALDTVNEEIETLKAEIAELDKSVAQATETRKEEHEEFLVSTRLSQTATELIEKAKQRLLKFYNPLLYKAPAVKKEMTMEEKIIEAGSSLAQVRTLRVRSHVAPLEEPKTFGDYEKKSEKSSGVMGLLDMITKELGSDMKDAEYAEKTAQADYTELMSASQAARAENVKSIVDKSAAVAAIRDKRFQAKQRELGDLQDVELIKGFVNDLHTSCDFILENFGVRKEARAQEVESLKNAKAVLSGAVFK